MPEGMEAQGLALHPKGNELLAEQLTETGSDFPTLRCATGEAGEEQSILRQCLAVIEQASANERGVNGDGAGTGVVLEMVLIVAIVDIEHDDSATIGAAPLNVRDSELRDFLQPHSAKGRDPHRPWQRRLW